MTIEKQRLGIKAAARTKSVELKVVVMMAVTLMNVAFEEPD